jgi:hypothetical protein
MYLTLELDGAESAFHSDLFTPGESLLADILPYAKRLDIMGKTEIPIHVRNRTLAMQPVV